MAIRVPRSRGRGRVRPARRWATSTTAPPTVSRSAAWANPKVLSPVTESPPLKRMPYQGRSRLATTTRAPITHMRSAGLRDLSRSTEVRSPASGEGSPATVARVEIVPVPDLVLAAPPAQVHLTTLDDRGEVDQAAIDVADH